VILQSSQVVTHYLQDQLKADIRRDELVMKGKTTREQADQDSDEWTEVRFVVHVKNMSRARAVMGRV
jgi:hypothetical protein